MAGTHLVSLSDVTGKTRVENHSINSNRTLARYNNAVLETYVNLWPLEFVGELLDLRLKLIGSRYLTADEEEGFTIKHSKTSKIDFKSIYCLE
jgi:hypothetical protein